MRGLLSVKMRDAFWLASSKNTYFLHVRGSFTCSSFTVRVFTLFPRQGLPYHPWSFRMPHPPEPPYEFSYSPPYLTLWASSIILDKSKALYPTILSPQQNIDTDTFVGPTPSQLASPLSITQMEQSLGLWLPLETLVLTYDGVCKGMLRKKIRYNE